MPTAPVKGGKGRKATQGSKGKAATKPTTNHVNGAAARAPGGVPDGVPASAGGAASGFPSQPSASQAAQGSPSSQVPPADQVAQLRKLFEVWVDSELKAQVVIFFNNNPGVVETIEGLARRLGLNATTLRDAVADHVRLGLLEERRLGDKTVLMYNRNRRDEIHGVVVDALHRRKEAPQ